MQTLASKAFLFCVICSAASWSSAATPKFSAGDCVSPVDPTFTWYGKFARVDALSKIEGFGVEKLYVLAFPNSVSNSVLFSLEIEKSVVKVADYLCVPR
jgi:hypothetical protein